MVNVASECGFTEEHYKQLQQLQRDFGPYHFNVLAFPCNQFGQQEPGSDKEIDSFVRRVYGVSFPLFSKIAVVGTGANNVYKYLVGELDGTFRTQLVEPLFNLQVIFSRIASPTKCRIQRSYLQVFKSNKTANSFALTNLLLNVQLQPHRCS